MAENLEKRKYAGFKKGLEAVYHTRTAAEYSRCMIEVREVCMTTENHSNSYATYLNKMKGAAPISAAEIEKLNAVFARYGVTDWKGVA